MGHKGQRSAYSAAMRVNVKLFAILRERTGKSDLPLELPEGETVRAAANMLGDREPAIAKYLARVAFAVNREYVPMETVLRDGDELAVIPPVSGGVQ
jgi:molybdopterin converting factor subunit 1